MQLSSGVTMWMAKTFFPKLPVHLRTNRKAFEKNERVRHIKQKLRGANAKISALNDALTSAATESTQRPEISIPKSMPDLWPQARHSEQCVIVGRMAAGHNSNNISNNLTPCNQTSREVVTKELARCVDANFVWKRTVGCFWSAVEGRQEENVHFSAKMGHQYSVNNA